MGRADVELLLDAARVVGQPCTLEAFPAMAMQALRSLVPGVSYSWTEVDLQRHRAQGIIEPADSTPSPALVEVFSAHTAQHPLVAGGGGPDGEQVHAISDFLNQRTYHRLELYGDFYRYLDTEDQLAIQLRTTPATVVGLVVNRDRRTFTERDRTVLGLLRSHVTQGYRSAEALSRLEQPSDLATQQAIWLTRGGAVKHATPSAQRLLDAYFGPERRRNTGLPVVVADWVCHQQGMDVDGLRGGARAPLRVPGPEGLLTVRLLIGPADESDLILLHERRTTLLGAGLASLGLTPRETEVVRLAVQGKTSGEMAELLGVRPRTVAKHLEHIYRRLGVTTRAGLVAGVRQAMGS